MADRAGIQERAAPPWFARSFELAGTQASIFRLVIIQRITRMSKVVAIMSMSLDGYVADRNDGVAEVFDWYFHSGDVEVHTGGSDPMTFTVSPASAEHI